MNHQFAEEITRLLRLGVVRPEGEESGVNLAGRFEVAFYSDRYPRL